MLLALTGATGFIGQHLVRELPKRGYRLRLLLRRPASVPMQTASAVIGDLDRPLNLSTALEGVDAVIHSAGLAQAMSGVPEDDYRVLNTEATIRLARAARRAGAKALRLPLLDPRPVRTDGRQGPVRGGRTEADRCLWRIQTRGRTRSGGTRPRLGVTAGSVGLRAWRQRQHGSTDVACSLALSTAARQPRSTPLAARAGKSVGGNRSRAGSTGNAAASIHCRRSAGADGRGNDCGHAPRAGAPA